MKIIVTNIRPVYYLPVKTVPQHNFVISKENIFLQNVYGFKTNHAIQKQSKSIFSNNRHTETITPARYNAGNHIKYDNSATDNFMPKHYFPDVEYPINILEASKPFYVVTEENNALLIPFSDDVITNFKSALIKPARKTKPEYFNKNKLKATAPKSVAYTAIGPENRHSPVNKNLINDNEKSIRETVLNKAHSDSPKINEQVTSQPAKTEHVKSENTSLPESVSQEYYEYEDTFSDTKNTNFDDEVEVFYSGEFFNEDSFENDSSENANVSEDEDDSNNYTPQNSTVERNEEPGNFTTLVEPDTCPLKECPMLAEKNNTKLNKSVVRKTKKIGLAPVQNVKQRKFLKYLNKRPSRYIP